MSHDLNRGFSTRAIHEGRGFAGSTGAVMPPVYLTSTFASGNADGFDYTRSGNPNFRLLEETVASLEGTAFSVCFSSGMAAITAVVSTLKTGDLVLAEENVYGCTYRLFDKVFSKFGVRVEYCDLSEPANWARITEARPALVWIESPTNPLLKLIDIGGVSRVAAEAGSAVVADNTFASPFLQRPAELGATLSLSSATKYLNGHSDCLGGTVSTNDPAWREKLLFAQKALGLNPSPFDAWLITRGVRTLPLRMERHCANALEIAAWLESLPVVKSVRYPFLPSHPQHDLARKQMRGGSGIVTAEFDFSAERCIEFCRSLRLFTLAESLGGVESLVCHPATMTHASVPRAVRLAVGLGDGIVRFSVGTENCADLKNDILQAAEKMTPTPDFQPDLQPDLFHR